MHRDTLTTHLGHADQLAFCAVAENKHVGRIRLEMLDRMVAPCGPAPKALPGPRKAQYVLALVEARAKAESARGEDMEM